MIDEQFKLQVTKTLTEVETTVKRMDRQLFGNGGPGEIGQIKKTLIRHDNRLDDAEHFHTGIRWAWWGIATVITVVGVIIGWLISWLH